jgi:hypothetical protein
MTHVGEPIVKRNATNPKKAAVWFPLVKVRSRVMVAIRITKHLVNYGICLVETLSRVYVGFGFDCVSSVKSKLMKSRFAVVSLKKDKKSASNKNPKLFDAKPAGRELCMRFTFPLGCSFFLLSMFFPFL